MGAASITPFQTWFVGTSSPLICNAPMYEFTDARLATAVTQAGGLGFIGGGFDFRPGSLQISTLAEELSLARTLLCIPSSSDILPIGVGFLTFDPINFSQAIVPLLVEYKPIAVWLFAPASRDQHAGIITALKAAGRAWGLKVFVQIGSVQAAREAVNDGCDILVVQGTDAGGHQSAQGAGLITLVPEISDMLADEYKNSGIPIVAAGGVMDGRGIAAALALGAEGVAMGTRFVVTEECPASVSTKSLMISTTDGGISTIKSTIHDDIKGTRYLWPVQYDGRAIIGDSYKDFTTGHAKEEVMLKYNAAMECDDVTRKIVWAGSGVGLIRSSLTAHEVVLVSRNSAKERIEEIQRFVDHKPASLQS
ncbi:putative 2-nitropropane dioxygenase family oxidoreductase [Stipitochalara longipes BDJ]|nr:putative 2-nitropropane dioxygenase family oxidoreductase [Stipitochalara longipes BDJ]